MISGYVENRAKSKQIATEIPLNNQEYQNVLRHQMEENKLTRDNQRVEEHNKDLQNMHDLNNHFMFQKMHE